MPINYQKTYDNLSYEEGIEFRDLTIKVLHEIYPHYIVQPIEAHNPDVIFIRNKQDNVRAQFPLRDLYLHYSTTARTKTDLKDTILNVYAEVLKTIEDAELIRDESKSQWSEVCDFIQPRLARIEEFPDELDEFDYYPFGVGIITHFVIVRPGEDGMVTRIRKNVREKWGKTVEELFKKAMENFANVTDGMELVGTDKPHQYLWNEKGVDFAATSILLGGMRFLIAETIGAPYRFGIPSSYVLYSWAELEDEEFQIEMKALMEREYKRLPAGLSQNIYEVDDTGQIKQLKNQPEIPKTPDFSNN